MNWLDGMEDLLKQQLPTLWFYKLCYLLIIQQIQNYWNSKASLMRTYSLYLFDSTNYLSDIIKF